MKSKKKKFIENYIIACVNFYGIIREDQLQKIYYKHHQETLDLSNLDYNYLKQDFVYHKLHFFMIEVFLEDDMMTQYISSMNQKPIYYPTKDELMKYSNNSYIESNEAIETFIDFVSHNTPKNKEIQYQNFIDEVLFSQNVGFDLNQLDQVLARNGVFGLKEQALLPLVADVCEHVRLWINNGFTNNELMNLDKNDPTIDFLDYGDIDLQIKQYLEDYKQAIREHQVNVPIDIYAFTNPSLNDLIEFMEEEWIDVFYDPKPSHLLSALIRAVYEKHELRFTDNRKAYYFKVLGIWTEKEEAEAVYEDLHTAFNLFDDVHSSLYLQNFYTKMNHQPIDHITKEDIRKLFYTQKNTPVNTKLKTKVEKLMELVIQGEEDPFNSLFNLCYLYPLSTLTLYELSMYGGSKYSEVLLKAVIQSFEISYRAYIQTPNRYKKNHLSFDTYMRSLKDLGMIYKRKQKYDEAVKVYEKILYCDEKDRFNAKSSLLICYIYFNQQEHYYETLDSLPDHHMVKQILAVLDMIESEENYDEYYQEVVSQYRFIFNHLLIAHDPKDEDLNLHEHEFVEDFSPIFQGNLKLKNRLLPYLTTNNVA